MQTASRQSTAWCRSAAASRELIIGDRQTGKSGVAIDRSSTEDDQRKRRRVEEALLRYVAIGQKALLGRPAGQEPAGLRRARVLDHRRRHASEPAPLQFLAPIPAAPWASSSATMACMRLII